MTRRGEGRVQRADFCARARANPGVAIANIRQPIQKNPLKSTLESPRKWRVCNARWILSYIDASISRDWRGSNDKASEAGRIVCASQHRCAQTVENQIRELSQVAERRGWEVVEIYRDAGISGAKGRDGRPGLDAQAGPAI
jgi:hypothetical protein